MKQQLTPEAREVIKLGLDQSPDVQGLRDLVAWTDRKKPLLLNGNIAARNYRY